MVFSLLHPFRIVLITVFVITLVAGPQITLAFEIGPKKKVHETLTLMASDCLSRMTSDQAPSICLGSPVAVMNNDVLNNTPLDLKTPGLGRVDVKDLAQAVRWPDDPTKEVGFWTIFKLGVKLLDQCEKKYNGGLEDGLLCSSHYGPLQFWHSMASLGEPTVETQRKMLAWAEFLYEIAVSDDELLKSNYCDYWNDPMEAGRVELASILAPTDRFPCKKSGGPWLVRTIFSMKCKNPFSSVKCKLSPDLRVARLNAIGALLHMVQDSYAQGHTDRNTADIIPENGRIKSKFECLPINQFYIYSAQDKKKHSQADAPPEPGRSCSNATKIHDPVLASANVLWLVKQKKGITELRKYLKHNVFKLAPGYEPLAGAGTSFKK